MDRFIGIKVFTTNKSSEKQNPQNPKHGSQQNAFPGLQRSHDPLCSGMPRARQQSVGTLVDAFSSTFIFRSIIKHISPNRMGTTPHLYVLKSPSAASGAIAPRTARRQRPRRSPQRLPLAVLHVRAPTSTHGAAPPGAPLHTHAPAERARARRAETCPQRAMTLSPGSGYEDTTSMYSEIKRDFNICCNLGGRVFSIYDHKVSSSHIFIQLGNKLPTILLGFYVNIKLIVNYKRNYS